MRRVSEWCGVVWCGDAESNKNGREGRGSMSGVREVQREGGDGAERV